MHKTTIYLREEVLTEIKLISRSEGRTEAEIVRAALDDYFERRRAQLPSVFGKGSSGTISAADSEDWLIENWRPE